MRYKILLLGLVFSIFISVVDARCCVETNSGEYCVSDISDCKKQVGAECNSVEVPECKLVCCMDNTGRIIGTGPITGWACERSNQTGNPTISEDRSYCIESNQEEGCCLGDYDARIMQKVQCDGVFLKEIRDRDLCRHELNSYGVKGCCIKGSGNCVTTTRSQCADGKFVSNKDCNDRSDSEINRNCLNCIGIGRTECTEDKSEVKVFDGCNNLIRSEDCVGNRICGEKGYENGELVVGCVNKVCEAGKKTFVSEYNLYTGEAIRHEVEITRDMLGFENKRDNGDSWCVIADAKGEIYSYARDGYTNKLMPWQDASESPGSRHYVYRCENGRIFATGCGEIRDSICKINSETNDAECVENKYSNCDDCGKEGTCTGYKCVRLGDCTIAGNECFPKYPPGYYWWNKNADNGYCNKHCGDGFWNRCDEQECYQNGDCEYDQPNKANMFIGCVAGAVIAEAVYYGASAGISAIGGGEAAAVEGVIPMEGIVI